MCSLAVTATTSIAEPTVTFVSNSGSTTVLLACSVYAPATASYATSVAVFVVGDSGGGGR